MPVPSSDTLSVPSIEVKRSAAFRVDDTVAMTRVDFSHGDDSRSKEEAERDLTKPIYTPGIRNEAAGGVAPGTNLITLPDAKVVEVDS